MCVCVCVCVCACVRDKSERQVTSVSLSCLRRTASVSLTSVSRD